MAHTQKPVPNPAPYFQAVSLIQGEFERRREKNSRYSLRAFAKFLELDASYLSKVLSGKKRLNSGSFDLIREKLGLDPTLLGEKPWSSSHYQQISQDDFRVIKDWYHFAILCLLEINGFDSNEEWIAEKLGIRPLQAKEALRRLLNIGLLQRSPSGKLVKMDCDLTSKRDGKTDEANRANQKQLLKKAIQAMGRVPIEMRDQSTIMMAVDSEVLPEAVKLIRDFRRKLCRVLQKRSGKRRNHVYALSTSFFPLTRAESSAQT